MSKFDFEFDPRFDLTFERTVDVRPELVWAAWTQPQHIVHWFTPAPWKTIHCEIDLQPGGLFRTVMQSPEGQEFPGDGCYLDVVENQQLVWTSALGPGYRPTNESGPDAMMFTGVILMEPSGEGTRYTAIAIHRNEEDKKKHEDMGFEHGWGAALDQLVAYMKAV